MPKEYTQEQFWQLYKNLPQELKDALFAEDTSRNIEVICRRNKILDHLPQMVDFVGQVLLGLLPPSDFQKTIKKNLKLKKNLAEKIALEINRFIFAPVEEALIKLYKIKITKPEKVTPKIKPSVKEAEKPKTRDIYREPIE